MTNPLVEAKLYNFQRWVECSAMLMQSNEDFYISIYRNRHTLYDAYLCIQKQRDSPILCCFPVNNDMVFLIDTTHLAITIKSYENITLIFIMENSKQFEDLLSQICLNMEQPPQNDDNSLRTINLSFLYSVQIPDKYLPLLSNGKYIKLKPNFAFSTPIIESAPHRKTWEKRIYAINSGYVTKPKTLRITFMTWNVASIKPNPLVLEEMMKAFHNGTGKADIIFIALQEIDMGVVSVVSGTSKVKDMWSTIIHAVVDFKNGEYRVASEATLGGIYAAVIFRNRKQPTDTNDAPKSQKKSDLLELVNIENKNDENSNDDDDSDFIEPQAGEVKTLRMGAHGLAANKGAIIFPITVGVSRFIFMGCHLTAHQEAWEARNQQLHQLMKFVEGNYDYLVIIGDLNYRIDLSYEDCLSFINKNDVPSLLEKDQLSISRKNEPILGRLKEPVISFLPTYKFDENSDVYDTSEKHRVPSYTDRILIRRGRKRISIGDENNTDVKPIFNVIDKPVYNFPSMPKCTDFRRGVCRFSDHRAVICAYKFQIPNVRDEMLGKLADEIYNYECDIAEFLVPKVATMPKSLNFTNKEQKLEIKVRNVSRSWVNWKFFGNGVIASPSQGLILPNYVSVLTLSIDPSFDQTTKLCAEIIIDGGKNFGIPITFNPEK